MDTSQYINTKKQIKNLKIINQMIGNVIVSIREKIDENDADLYIIENKYADILDIYKEILIKLVLNN